MSLTTNLAASASQTKATAQSSTTYLAGLPLTEERQLDQEETALLHDIRKTWRISFKITLFLWITAVWSMTAISPEAAVWLGIILAPVCVIVGTPYVRLSRAIKSNRLQIFRGQPSRIEGDQFQAKIKHRITGRKTLEIRFLPEPQMVLSVAEVLPTDFVFSRTKPIRPTPHPSARKEAGLTDTERQELRRLTGLYWTRALALTPFFLLWLCLTAVLPALFSIPDYFAMTAALAINLALLIKLSPARLFKLTRLLWRLSADFRAGTVATDQSGREVLPKSRLLWSQNGRPGAWRLAQPPIFLRTIPKGDSSQLAIGTADR